MPVIIFFVRGYGQVLRTNLDNKLKKLSFKCDDSGHVTYMCAHVGGQMVSGIELGREYQQSSRKSILARLVGILAILLCFSARGTKINNIILEKKHNFGDFFFMLNNFSDVEISDFL